jgi:hypothetical protein
MNAVGKSPRYRAKLRVQPIHTTSQMTTVFNNSVRRIDQACRRGS